MTNQQFFVNTTVFDDRLPRICLPDDSPPELEVCYDEVGRWYRSPTCPNRSWYPSITTVLKVLSEAAIARWKKKLGHEEAGRQTEHACQRGTATHEVLENFCRGTAIPTGHDEALCLAGQIVPILRLHCSVVRLLETQLWSDKLRTAGRCDLVGDWGGIPSIIDFKTAKRLKPEDWITAYYLQCCFYAIALWQRYQIRVAQAVILLANDQNEPQIYVKKLDRVWLENLLSTRARFSTKYGEEPKIAA